MTSRRKRISGPIRAILLSIALSSLAVLGLEGALRLSGFRFSIPIFDDLRDRTLLVSAGSGLVEVAPELANPNAFGYSFAVNPRRAPFPKKKPPGVFRVALVADSLGQIFQFELPRFEARLTETLGQPAEVLNLSFSGCGSERTLPSALEALELGPDVIVVATGHSDFVSHCDPSAFFGEDRRPLADTIPPWQKKAFRASRVLQFIAWAGARIFRDSTTLTQKRQLLGGVQRPYSEEEKKERHAAFGMRLREIAQAARNAGARLVLLTMPNNYDRPPIWEYYEQSNRLNEHNNPALARWAQGHRKLKKGQLAEAKKLLDEAYLLSGRPYVASVAINNEVRRVAREENALLLDLKEIVDRASPRGLAGNDFLADHCHLGLAGNRLLAEELLRVLVHLSKLPTSPLSF